MKNKNAKEGTKAEYLIKDTFVKQKRIINKCKETFNIKGNIIKSEAIGAKGNKADVELKFSDNKKLYISVKSYGNMGFNQLTRTSVSNFCKTFNISEKEKELSDIIVNKSKNTKDYLFSQERQKIWKPIFKRLLKNILRWAFSNNKNKELLALYDKNNFNVKLYLMKTVLKRLNAEDITFTKGGFDIKDCVSFQRKGGNGVGSKHISKYDIKHPGNNIQIKLKISKFIDIMKNNQFDEYSAR